MNNDFKEKMINFSKKIDIEIEEEQLKKYFKYMNLLLEWNKKINLTAITELDDIILKHFIDSMTVLKHIKECRRLVDVGTGAGFPGIPIAIMRPDLQITLLDSLNKRIIFLDEVVKELDLKNIKTVHGRAEDFGQNMINREKYDIAVSRAVANMTTLSEYMIPLIKVGGKCIFMKGSEIDKELEDARFAIKELGGKIINIDNFKLPDTDMERNVISIEKVKETPKIYPRKSGLPSKQPLK